MKTPRSPVYLGYPTGTHGRIPSFNSVEEEAEFWDTHDFTDFEEESTLVEVSVGSELAERLTVRLDQGERKELARRARRLGVDSSTLARMWIREHLRGELEAETSTH